MLFFVELELGWCVSMSDSGELQRSHELARLAPDYPFPHPHRSFVFVDGQAVAPAAVAWSREGRTPVIAYGSNRSPEVLSRKYARESGVVVPTVQARLRDFDVVYAAMVSTLGPVPATLAPSPGAICDVAVQFLTPSQLERIHRSERVGVSYGFANLPADAIDIEDIGRCECWLYYCLYGVLRHEDEPVALAEVGCQGRRWRAMTQRDMQSLVRRRLGSTATSHDFLVEHIADEAVRRERITRLSADAIHYEPQWLEQQQFPEGTKPCQVVQD